MTLASRLTLTLLCGLLSPAALGSAAYRQYEVMEDYVPHVRGDMQLSGSYRHWRDPRNLDWRLAGNPEENWKMNWKFMDPPFNASIHGGHFALDRGAELYRELNAKGRFGACLGAEKGDLKGLRTRFPTYRSDLKRMAGLEEIIELCGAKAGRVLQNGSYDNSALSLYVANQSYGMPIRLDVSRGPARDAFERGRKLFHTRTGRSNYACATCHSQRFGLQLRGTTITTPYGDVAHYPVYRTRYQLQSLHLRFVECSLDTGTQALWPGSRPYTDLEVFLTALSNGYPVSVPSERD